MVQVQGSRSEQKCKRQDRVGRVKRGKVFVLWSSAGFCIRVGICPRKCSWDGTDAALRNVIQFTLRRAKTLVLAQDIHPTLVF
jgi:hypothetical protein